MYIPALNFMLAQGRKSATDITVFTIWTWLTWIIKPVFGYLCDYYPIFNRRITPYVVLGCVVNIAVLTLASILDLKKTYAGFIVVLVTGFASFSPVDAVARKLP
jgi:hypothetical protein